MCPDSPENKCPTVECPDCGGQGSDEGGFRGGKKWKAICPRCGGSGRINTSGPDDSKIENKYQGSPSVPDREGECPDCEGESIEGRGCRTCNSTGRVVSPSPDRVTVNRDDLRIAVDWRSEGATDDDPDEPEPEPDPANGVSVSDGREQ